jgi:hypothetical protein
VKERQRKERTRKNRESERLKREGRYYKGQKIMRKR